MLLIRFILPKSGHLFDLLLLHVEKKLRRVMGILSKWHMLRSDCAWSETTHRANTTIFDQFKYSNLLVHVTVPLYLHFFDVAKFLD